MSTTDSTPTPPPSTEAPDYEYFCQWCYDRGLRYSSGKWGHAIGCPHAPTIDAPAPSAEVAALKAEVGRLRAAVGWCLDMNPSPCRCLSCATPPHVCVAHKALSAAAPESEAVLLVAFSALTDERRMEVFSHFCRHCGAKDPGCHCTNDE